MCRCGETVHHLLLHCGKAHRLWSFVFRTFGISWVLTRLVANFLFGWSNWLGKHSSIIWNLAPLCLMWCICRECNPWTFENLDRSDDQLLAFFIGSLFDWSRAWWLTSSESIPSFLSSSIFAFLSFFVIFDMLCASLHKVFFWIYVFLAYQKKKKKIVLY